MSNRLAQLQAAEQQDEHQTSVPRPGTSAVQMPIDFPEDPLETCFKLVAEIQDGNRKLQAKTAELRTKGAEVLKSIDPKEDKTTEAMQLLMDEANGISKRVKGLLDTMASQTKKLSSNQQTAEAHAATLKIHENQHAHLSRTFLQVMQEYKQVVSENEANIRKQTARRIKLKHTDERGCSISDGEADRMAQEMLDLGREDAVLDMARGKLAEILETREDLKKMERSMRELHQIFNDLAVIINEQSELMDQILTNVQHSVAYVESGRENLQKAKKHAKKSRRNMMCFMLPLGIIFFFVLAVVLGFTV